MNWPATGSPCVLVVASSLPLFALAAAPESQPAVPVVQGVVLPCRPVADAITDAMLFLKKADDGYVPGRMDGQLAGYFESAFVKPHGARSDRRLAFPGRQHAYFIRTFLSYYAYTGQQEWLLRARDLADWNLAHRTPADAVYANLPYSTFSNGQPGGSRDEKSIEPDKAAFLGSGFLAVFEATGDAKYLQAAGAVAQTLVRCQRENGSWPFRVLAQDGRITQDFGGAPVFFVEFFDQMSRHEAKAAYREASQRALKYTLATHVERNAWGTYHEDVRVKDEGYLSAEPMSFTADYLFRQARTHPEYAEMGRTVLRRMEEKLVHTQGHAAAPGPAVAEQAGFNHIMPGHTARYCLALADLYALTGDQEVRRRALSGVNATTYMQNPAGLFATFFYDVNRKTEATGGRPDWYSQHLYTVCHVLEIMARLTELAPEGQDHLLGSSVAVRLVEYSPGEVAFESIAASRAVLKLSFVPVAVKVGSAPLPQLKEAPVEAGAAGWFFDPAAKVLTICHRAGRVNVKAVQ